MFSCTFHLHFWQNKRDLLSAAAEIRRLNGHRNKNRHRKLTLEIKIPLPLLSGLEPATFRSRVRRFITELPPLPRCDAQEALCSCYCDLTSTFVRKNNPTFQAITDSLDSKMAPTTSRAPEEDKQVLGSTRGESDHRRKMPVTSAAAVSLSVRQRVEMRARGQHLAARSQSGQHSTPHYSFMVLSWRHSRKDNWVSELSSRALFPPMTEAKQSGYQRLNSDSTITVRREIG